MTIINMTNKNLKVLMKEKIIKATNTNGLKQQILNIIADEQLKRTAFNKYEVINTVNAIARTKFFRRRKVGLPPTPSMKYRAVRDIGDGDENALYKMEYLQGNLILDLT